MPSHGTNRGSNPLRDANEIKDLDPLLVKRGKTPGKKHKIRIKLAGHFS